MMDAPAHGLALTVVHLSQAQGFANIGSPELGDAPGEVPVAAVRGKGVACRHRVRRLVAQQYLAAGSGIIQALPTHILETLRYMERKHA